eukprot:jgi/Orpsp1_1/1190084/evm.model.d7180000076491.1
MISLAGTPQLIDAPWVFEDSGINKIGNTYFYSYCTNWAGGPHGNARIGYMTSNSPMGPFTFQGTCFNNPGDFFGTTGQAKGTLKGVNQLKDVDGSALNYAASFAWQSGISVSGQGAVTTVNYGRGGWTGVSNVALGGASSITLKASSSSGATVKICAGSENGTVLGYVDIPSGGQMKNVSGNLTGATGTKSLFFIASGNLSIESWTLGSGASSNNSNKNNSQSQPESKSNSQPQPQPQPNPNINNNNNNGQNTNTGTSNVVDGWYYVKNVGTNKYLQVKGNKGAPNTNVEVGSFTGSAGQKWKVTHTSDGYITLTSSLGNYMLDSNQAWSFESVNGNSNKNSNNNGTPTINNSSNSNSGCWSKALGFNCCNSCGPVYYIDKDGEWGIINGQWCGMPKSCQSYASIANSCKGVNGYSCCAFSCTAYEKDSDGEWSVENNQWCLINKAI